MSSIEISIFIIRFVFAMKLISLTLINNNCYYDFISGISQKVTSHFLVSYLLNHLSTHLDISLSIKLNKMMW